MQAESNFADRPAPEVRANLQMELSTRFGETIGMALRWLGATLAMRQERRSSSDVHPQVSRGRRFLVERW